MDLRIWHVDPSAYAELLRLGLIVREGTRYRLVRRADLAALRQHLGHERWRRLTSWSRRPWRRASRRCPIPSSHGTGPWRGGWRWPRMRCSVRDRLAPSAEALVGARRSGGEQDPPGRSSAGRGRDSSRGRRSGAVLRAGARAENAPLREVEVEARLLAANAYFRLGRSARAERSSCGSRRSSFRRSGGCSFWSGWRVPDGSEATTAKPSGSPAKVSRSAAARRRFSPRSTRRSAYAQRRSASTTRRGRTGMRPGTTWARPSAEGAVPAALASGHRGLPSR